MRHSNQMRALFALVALALALTDFSTQAGATGENTKRFEKEGLNFDFSANWELSDRSNPAAQQLVLTEKALDAQIMIVALRGTISSAKQEEEAKAC